MENESVKKSIAKSKNVLEEKRKIVKQKNCIKKDTHVYNNCYELRSRAINKQTLYAERLNITDFSWKNCFRSIKGSLNLLQPASSGEGGVTKFTKVASNDVNIFYYIPL